MEWYYQAGLYPLPSLTERELSKYRWGLGLDLRSGDFLIFNPAFSSLSKYDIQFVSLQIFDPVPANSFDSGDFYPFSLFHNFLFSFPHPDHMNGQFCPSSLSLPSIGAPPVRAFFLPFPSSSPASLCFPAPLHVLDFLPSQVGALAPPIPIRPPESPPLLRPRDPPSSAATAPNHIHQPHQQ